jgi:hypothetical protein
VNVGGNSYNVTTFTGAYNDYSSNFTVEKMPWFGGGGLPNGLAIQFVNAVGCSLGCTQTILNRGPYFAYDTNVNWWAKTSSGNTQGATATVNDSNTWAILADAPPVPGPLPTLGAAAAFGFSRKLRKRIKLSANAVSST